MVESLAEARSHNVPPEVFLRHYREIRDAKQAHADTGMAVARAKKAAKGDGVDLDALKLLEKLASLDTDEAELQLKHLRLYAQWIELPIGMQPDFFGDPEPATVSAKAQAEQREWTAGSDGFEAGEAGRLRDSNPHPIGSELHVVWDKSWTNGNKRWLKAQKTIAAEMGKKTSAAEQKAFASGMKNSGNGAAASRKRGRPAKSETSATAH